MAKKSSYLIGGLAIAVMTVGALSAAQGIGATVKEAPVFQVDRSAKGDRLATPGSVAVKKAPSETARETIPTQNKPSKRKILDGCDPMFSPVVVPTMAHVAGRCVG
jgi:hypothetical protein